MFSFFLLDSEKSEFVIRLVGVDCLRLFVMGVVRSLQLLVGLHVGDPDVLEDVLDQLLHQRKFLLVEVFGLDGVLVVREELVEQREDAPRVRLLDDESLEQVPAGQGVAAAYLVICSWIASLSTSEKIIRIREVK